MSEVAKVREALERLVPCLADHKHDEVCATYTRLERAFVAHGLKVCEKYEEQAAGHEDAPLHCVVCASKYRRLELVTDILRDAGLLEASKS